MSGGGEERIGRGPPLRAEDRAKRTVPHISTNLELVREPFLVLRVFDATRLDEERAPIA